MGILDSFSLSGKVAVVTGGAGLYGKQIGMALSQAGAVTYVSSRNPDNLGAIEADYRRQGCEVRALQLDQSEPASVEAFRQQILAGSGRVDILVNNAAAREMSGWDDAAGFARSMEINAKGLYLVTRAFGETMKSGGGGSIVNIGSIYGVAGPNAALYEGMNIDGFKAADYYFHKGGMLNLTRFIASYYGPYRIRCNYIILGGLRSERVNDEFAERYGKYTFLGRMANDTDLMGAIVYLASDASSYVTGSALAVDGGYTAK